MGLKFCKTADESGRPTGNEGVTRLEQEHVQLRASGRQGRVRQGLAGGPQEDEGQVRVEGDVQDQVASSDQNHLEELREVRHEREADPHADQPPLPREHGLLLPGPREPVPGDGLAGGRRPAVPHRASQDLQRGDDQ